MRLVIQVLFVTVLLAVIAPSQTNQIGREVSIERRLLDGDEYTLSTAELIRAGKALFRANWTVQEGGGRPMSKGTGDPLTDRNAPLLFPRNFNRISGPDANSCAGCHNSPVPGGAGDIVGNVFVLGQRLDFATFGAPDGILTGGSLDERGRPLTLQTAANFRSTLGMFGFRVH